jgi:hypothetical protein
MNRQQRRDAQSTMVVTICVIGMLLTAIAVVVFRERDLPHCEPYADIEGVWHRC